MDPVCCVSALDRSPVLAHRSGRRIRGAMPRPLGAQSANELTRHGTGNIAIDAGLRIGACAAAVQPPLCVRPRALVRVDG